MKKRTLTILPAAAFLLSGVSAIVSQVCWQRILTVLSGIDTISMTTVVAAFMVGLGIGNLAGGKVGDRLTPASCFAAYVLIEGISAMLIWFSPFLLYDLYGKLAPFLVWLPLKFLVEVSILVVPTLLMGATLPILSRGLVRTVPEIAGTVGHLYGVNTLGAALGGLLVAGPWLLGRYGIAGTIHIAAALNIAAGILVIISLTMLKSRSGRAYSNTYSNDEPLYQPLPNRETIAPWLGIYALSGFVALSLEILWFRVLQVVLVANTYTFAILLCTYLTGLGLGAWLMGFFVSRIRNPRSVFLLFQFAVTQVGVIGTMLVLLRLIFHGWRLGGLQPSSHVLGNPLFIVTIIVLPATVLMGASYPLIQRVVAKNLGTLGRRTGALLFANTVGSFFGAAVTGLVLMQYLGTPQSLKLIGFLGIVFLLVENVLFRHNGIWRLLKWVLLVSPLCLMLLFPLPNNFWAAFYRVSPQGFAFYEDRTGVVGLKISNPDVKAVEAIIAQGGGFWQTPFPFDDFHLTLGLLPLFTHSQPRRALAIGLGIGSTPSAMAADPRLDALDVVEIYGGEEPLLRRYLGNKPEFRRLFENPRVSLFTDDGRRFLLHSNDKYDVIVSDPTLIWWPCGVCLYTKEFYELVRSRLAPGGILAQWVTTNRVATTAAAVFPNQIILQGAGFRNGIMLLSDQPLSYDATIALTRLEETSLEPHEHRIVKAMLQNGIVSEPPARTKTLNTDLFPRDEYLLRRCKGLWSFSGSCLPL